MAEVELTHAIEIFPDYFDALEMLGTEYVKHAFYDAATPLLAHAVEVNKEAWHSYYGLGVSLLELGKRQEGIDSLRRALDVNPKSINTGMRLGLELAKDGEHTEEAIKVLSNVTEMAGKQLPEAYLALASLYSKNKHYKLAAEALEGYLQTAPTSAQRESIKLKIEDLRKKEKSATNEK
jgi:tetratricopeptide (TPR) repeat protein